MCLYAGAGADLQLPSAVFWRPNPLNAPTTRDGPMLPKLYKTKTPYRTGARRTRGKYFTRLEIEPPFIERKLYTGEEEVRGGEEVREREEVSRRLGAIGAAIAFRRNTLIIAFV